MEHHAKDWTDVEVQNRGDSEPATIPKNGENGMNRGTLESEHAQHGWSNGNLGSQQKGLDAPYFQEYLSPAFFGTCIGAILIIWVFCWLYIGAFWDPTTRLKNLHVIVLNCDKLPGNTLLNASLVSKLVPTPVATGLLSASIWNTSFPLSKTLWWENATCPGVSSAGVCGTPQQEADCVASYSNDVLQGGPWAMLYFPSNFTASYLSFFPGSGLVGNSQGPVAQYVYARGRDYSTYTYLGTIIVNKLIPRLSHSFTGSLANNTMVTSIAKLSPAFLVAGISVMEVDLAPVKNFGQHFATYIFCVLLWLGSSFVVASSYQYKLPAELMMLDPNRSQTESSSDLKKRLMTELLIKGLVAVVFMFVLMVLLCIVLWALGAGNEQWHLNPGYAMAFGWYVSWSFISINAVLLHIFGIERFSSIAALLLILQLTSASGVMTLEICNRFFYIGKGLPFFYGVRGFRTIFFGAYQDKMYINWLVLTAYNIVFAPLGLILVAYRIRKNGGKRPGEVVSQRAGNAAGGVSEIVMPVAGAVA